ncbi:MAG TPA: L,D-transpeptidase family protein [Gaiellaceae bacterium]|jgi:lipoprotein-anchoring transpeptidase ErfK/SrfK|nr:L,D-transpeptidase family protein [Gaiellaceae bacterium]
MRRGVLIVVAALACLLAGLFSAAVLAASGPLGALTTITLPTTTLTTTTPTTTTGTTTREPQAEYIAEGVSVGKIDVGGMTPAEAKAIVLAKFNEALQIHLGRSAIAVPPGRLGATARVRLAIEQARRAAPDARVPLFVNLRAGGISRYVKALARRFDRTAKDAELAGLRNLRPWITKERAGRELKQRTAVRRIVAALRTHQRIVRIRAVRVDPVVTRERFGPIVVIRRDSKRLHVYRGMRLWKRFGVATGQSEYPTPIGDFSIVTMQRHPWWYPPDSDWAEGEEPIPPGPGNPLGTRWMGLSASGVGMHGTPDAASIGYSASHGCIRMRIAEAEWLFNRVRVGTPVFIVRA